MRRRYVPGTCQDCGRSRNVTRATFWASGFVTMLCGECVRQYRRVLCC